MNQDSRICKEVLSYLKERAPVLFFILTDDGEVVEANTYAERIAGPHLIGKKFKNLIIDFTGRFDLMAAVGSPPMEHLLNIGDPAELPQSYYFTFRKVSDDILVFGRLDVEEITRTREEILILNQDMNNLTRELHKKNAALRRLNQDLEAANETILELTRTDPLTQLANRRYFDERIQEMVSLAKRRSQPLSLIMTDIDKFKHVNDAFGHDAGDRVLVGYAELMKQAVRKEDLVARFGGEEFIILLPHTGSDEAYALAERIRERLSQQDFLGNHHRVTASFGISQLRADEAIPEFIKRADAALYRAKASGRNRTVLAGPDAP
jgi:diguanylate cyclase (GGDEF)-like protein